MDNGSEPVDRLQRITDELAEETKAAQERVERAKGAWELAKAEAQHVFAALRALDPEHELVKVKPKSKSKGQGPPREATTRVWDWVVKHDPSHAFTIREVAEDLDYSSDDSVRRAIYALRDAEALRAAGKIKSEKGHPATQFRMMDLDAGEELVKALNGG